MAAPKGPPPKGPKVDLDDLVKRWEADKKSRLFLQVAEEYRKKDAFDAAISVLKEGLKHHGAFAPAHVALARCLMGKGQLAQAQAELEPIVQKAPDNLLAGKLLAQVLQERGERQRALDVLQRLEPFAAGDGEISDRLALLKLALGPGSAAPASSTDTAEFSTGEIASDVGSRTMPPRPAPLGSPMPLPAPPVGFLQPLPRAAPVPPAEQPLDAIVVDEEEEAASPPAALPPVPRPTVAADDLLGAPLAGPPEQEDEDEFTSVTLAELYEAQGGHREAAAIYQRLLARKPGDPTLLRALERCRAREIGATPEPAVAAIASPPPPPPTRPRWEPVRPREPAPAEPAMPVAEPAAARASAFRAPARGPETGLRATRRKLQRLLAAVEAVRAAR